MNRSLFVRFITYEIARFNSRNNFGTWSSLGATFNTRPERRYTLIKDNSGLFSVPELQSHEGFQILKEQCLSQTHKLVLEATEPTRKRKMVEIFDDLSDSLCKVADLAEFIRVAHPSPNFTKAAQAASSSVSGIVEELNVNIGLYQSLLNVVRKGDILHTNDVDTYVAKLFLFDFEQSGIHLSETDRRNVLFLNEYLLHMGQLFVSGCTNSKIFNKNLIPENVRHIFAVKGNHVTVSGLCADSKDVKARETAYRIYFCPDSKQEQILNDLLEKRNQLAQMCGFPTFAHRALKGSTLETPAIVMEFLDYLSKGLRSRAEMDFQTMTNMKESEIKQCNPLAMWDTFYYTKKAKQHIFNVESSDCSPYFSLGACMEGLDNLTYQLYGINLVAMEMTQGEKWNNDVYKLAVRHKAEGLLGYIYCDFYERSGKPNQDCHFTIRGGRLLSDGSYQLPIVVLMLSFPLPKWSTPTLLSPDMVDNLFHEMGHAMHSMLARTHYQHVTGTRCSTDFAEVPSVLMEYFAGDIRVLRTFAKHFQTKEPMPEDMLQRLCASKHVFLASEMQVQVFYAVLDQLYHGSLPLEGSATDVLAKIQEKYYSLPYVKNTAWQLRFSHLVSYGAKYYSYLFSRALASCIWQSYFENDPLNPVQGEKYRRECLGYGGGKPPRQLLKDYLGKEPSTSLLAEALLRDVDRKTEALKMFDTK